MKNNNLKWISMVAAIMLFVLVTGCNSGNEAQNNAGEAGNMKLGDGTNENEMMQEEGQAVTVDTKGEPAFIVNYMDIKNALVNDNYDQVKQAVSDMQNSLTGSDLGDAQQNELEAILNQLAEAQDIEVQRQQFAALSHQLYEVVQNADLADKTLYWQHCPMAMNNEGANWLSYKENIQNPFMGQKMAKCGSVVETI